MDVPMVVGEKGMQVRDRETVRSAREQSARERASITVVILFRYSFPNCGMGGWEVWWWCSTLTSSLLSILIVVNLNGKNHLALTHLHTHTRELYTAPIGSTR